MTDLPSHDVLALTALEEQLQRESAHCEVIACSLEPIALRAVFARIAAAKRGLAASLAACRQPRRDPHAHAGLMASGAALTRPVFRIYARWLPQNGGQARGIDAETIALLSRAEDRLLQQFDRALQGAPAPALRRVLKRYLPQIQSCHAELFHLQAAHCAPSADHGPFQGPVIPRVRTETLTPGEAHERRNPQGKAQAVHRQAQDQVGRADR